MFRCWTRGVQLGQTLLVLVAGLFLLSTTRVQHVQAQQLERGGGGGKTRNLNTFVNSSTSRAANTSTAATELRGIRETCNRRNPCAEGLTCMRAPSRFGVAPFRKVCFPLDCLATAAQEYQDKANMTAYQEFIFAKAGVSNEEFFMLNENQYQEDEDGGTRVHRRRPFSALSVVREMQRSPKVHRVMRTIEQNPPNMEDWKTYEDALAACDPNNALSQRSIFRSGPTLPGALGLVGFGAGLGAVLGGGVEFFFSFPNAIPEPYFYIDLGGGLLFGIDAGVSVSIGVAFTGNPADIPGVGFELDLQIPTPFVGPGISIGVDINNVWDLSFLVNLGLGIAIGGFSAGYTWGFPDTYNRSTIV